MQHVVEVGDRFVGVGEDGEIYGGFLCIVDVTNPFVMLVERVDTDGDGLDVTLGKFAGECGGFAELGGAHRREVSRMRKQHHPRVARPLMKMDRPFGGVLREIGRGVAQAEC